MEAKWGTELHPQLEGELGSPVRTKVYWDAMELKDRLVVFRDEWHLGSGMK